MKIFLLFIYLQCWVAFMPTVIKLIRQDGHDTALRWTHYILGSTSMLFIWPAVLILRYLNDSE